LLRRQDEVDAVVRDIVAPAMLRGDDALREELAAPVPLQRVVKLHQVRNVVDSAVTLRRRPVPPVELSLFDQAIRLAARTADGWGGKLIVVVLPNYALSTGVRATGARYDAVMRVLNASPLRFIDGAALFAAQHDAQSLYTLRIDNHPSEIGHALLASAILDLLREEAK
jgi:hypothetical protein